MDLVAGVRKEGSRGGRDSFKWSDVKDSQHRENYLGHSLMAPVGRWQKGKDLSWYAKGDEGEDAASKAEQEREEEIRRVKEAEQDALSRALGLPVAPKTNANMTPLGGNEVEKAIKDTADDDDGDGEGARGVGFGAFGGTGIGKGDSDERIEGVGIDPTVTKKGHKSSRKDRRGRSRSREGGRRRDRSRERHREKDRMRRDHERHHQERRRHRSRSHDREHRRRSSRSRSRSRERKREHVRDNHRHRDRSRSPDDRRDHHRYSRERHGDYRRR